MKKIISLVFVLALGLASDVVNADFIFGTSTNLGLPVNPAGCPNISADGLELYFSSVRSGGYGQDDLWVWSRRPMGNKAPKTK